MQLGQVGGSALGEVAVHLDGDPYRDGGLLHQLGARLPLAPDDDHRPAQLTDPPEPAAQVLGAAQDAGHHHVAVLDPAHLDVRVAARVRQQVVGAGRTGREQVRVGGGQQRDAGHRCSFVELSLQLVRTVAVGVWLARGA